MNETIKPVGWSSLAGLLDDLTTVSKEHEEIFDTDVREKMWAYLESRFIKYNVSTLLPEEYGMFSQEANYKVREAFEKNTKNLDAIINAFELDTEEKRMITFTNPKLTVDEGYHLDDFFGAP